MRNDARLGRFVALIALALLAMLDDGCANKAAQIADADIPAELRVSGSRVATVHAKGVQIYVCKMKDGQRVWEFKAPEATFAGTDSAGRHIEGKHYKGETGPVWESNDGSSVMGKMIRKHDREGAIPLLLIQATSNKGTGVFSTVRFVQRLNTSGGVAPAVGDAKIGDEVRVDYTADYVFYGGDATTQPA
jgi:hypothetical protein